MEVYNWPAPNFVVSYMITDTINHAGKIYFALRSDPNAARYFREDSNRYIYEYFPGIGEFLLFDFSMQPGDSIKYEQPPKRAVVLLSRSATVNAKAGIFSNCLAFMYDRVIPYVDDEEYYYFAKNVGLVRYNPVWNTSEYLLGAYVNGRLIGDTTTVGVDDRKAAITKEYVLSQNYPNPFNPETKIFYQLPEAKHVRLLVYNLLGEQIRVLENTEKPAGNHIAIWDGQNESGARVASGAYLLRLESDSRFLTRKMLLLP